MSTLSLTSSLCVRETSLSLGFHICKMEPFSHCLTGLWGGVSEITYVIYSAWGWGLGPIKGSVMARC